MIIKAFSKIVVLGSAGSAIYLSNAIEVPNTLPPRQLNLQNASFNNSISNLEDIRLFERFHNCSFVFVGSWSKGTTYNFEKFLEEYTGKTWETRVIKGANSFKQHCKDKKVVTLAFQGTAFLLRT